MDMVSDACSLPQELLENVQPTIGFTGLDITKNAVHKTVWDAFNSSRKSDGSGVQFKIIPTNFEFPTSKPKLQSYEWNHPKGILKKNWMKKHLHILPPVVIFFRDIEWNDPQWTDKQYECASLMQSVKNSLQGRKTRFGIVLIQKNISKSQADEQMATERTANLSSVCDINQKLIFTLPYNDHLMGYTLRLESAFSELSQSYYSDILKLIRVHRDQTNSANQSLRVRHQFKSGFISELKLDLNTALKHYTQAYVNLDEIRVVDTNCLEIKIVAGFINFKMCKIMFKVGQPREAITQFKNHIDKYRDRPGFQELIFEHFSWLSIQYSSFAELFCDAIKCGLPAIQTQHPGIYYHKAAEYTGQRKESFLRCCELLPSQNSPQKEEVDLKTNLATILYSEFFGVRGASKSVDPTAEQQIFTAVKELERTVKHSAIIITLLGQAMAQFKIYKCPRYRKKLAIDMAEEYMKCGEHSKALTLYSLMLSDYRTEKWDNIFTDVLLKTLRSAFLSSSVPDFIECSVEALSNNIGMDESERIIVLENLWKVFHNVPPIAPSQIAPELKRHWETALSSFKKTITINLDKISELLECSVTFKKAQIKQNEAVRVYAFIRSSSNVALKLRDFSVYLSDTVSKYKLLAKNYTELNDLDIYKILKESNGFQGIDDISRQKQIDNLSMMHPNICYKICFESEQNQFAESSMLQITKFEVIMGSPTNFVILTQSTKLNKTNCFKSYNPIHDYLENFKANRTCYIVPIFHLSTQNNSSNQPMLVNECFQVVTAIQNAFDVYLENVGLSITVPDHLINKVFISTDLTKGRQRLSSQIQMDVGDVQIQSNSSISYYIISLVEGNIELIQKIWYQSENIQGPKISPSESISDNSPVFSATSADNIADIQNRTSQLNQTHNIDIEYVNDGVRKTKKETIIVPCIEEFKLSGKFYTLNKQALTKAYKNEDFLFRVDIEIKSPFSIDILDMYLICDYNISQRSYSKQGKRWATYSKGDKLQDVIILRSQRTSAEWITNKDYLEDAHKGLFPKSKADQAIAADIKAKPAAKLHQKPLYKSPDNLLAKIPINTSIMNTSFEDDLNQSIDEDVKLMTLGINNLNKTSNESRNILATKNIYNSALDGFYLTDHCKGFIKKECISAFINTKGLNNLMDNHLGIYCLRWRRTNSNAENETKLLVNGLEIIEAPLNIYCYLEERIYVKMSMTLTITLKNTSNVTLHLKSCLKNAENFMFAGNSQLNISIFAGSEYDITFNLYPLKAGWQFLPELQLTHNTPEDVVSQQQNEKVYNNNILQNLIDRWMPKKIYVIPMIRDPK